MKTKYVICIGARAKDAVDHWRLANDIGRFSYARLIHSSYIDNRPAGARRSDVFSTRQRPVTVQTNLGDEQIVELLELTDKLDVLSRYDNKDSGMISNLLGTFLDAVIMGDLISTSLPAPDFTPGDQGRPLAAGDEVQKHNLSQAALQPAQTPPQTTPTTTNEAGDGDD